MDKIKLDVLGLTYSQTQNNAYALILKEANGKRRLPIIIGGFEAQSIAIQIEKIKYSRPLTHDLFKNLATAFEISIIEIIIYRLDEGVFYAHLICKTKDKEIELDARTSDAVSLALRFGCPIFTYEQIMQTAAIDNEAELIIDDPDDIELEDEPKPDAPTLLKKYSDEELSDFLKIALATEDYEQASFIRDEIKRRTMTDLQ
jgi:hypothetical protein